MEQKKITLGEFKRLAAFPDLIIGAQEAHDGKFIAIAINTDTQVCYTARHAAKDVPRTWRLDRLAMMFQSIGVTSFQVRQEGYSQ